MEGRVLAGRFRLVEMLGQGGMGSVWRARHLELDVDVAVKLMDPSLTTHSEGLARFRREAQAAASLKSPNVVQVFDYGVDGDTPYIAMEMLQGESLAKRLERSRRLPVKAAASILSQVARAVGKAHDAGIVHRDLKPENIFLVLDDDVEIAKVLDFGIAKRTGPGDSMMGAVQTQTGAMLGTPYYMSPEQAAGKKDVDHRTDIWSFGVIACECLTGRRMFDSDSLGGLVLAICTEPLPPPSQLGPVPPGFDEWFSHCVHRDRQARFQTIREAASALDAIGRGTTNGVATRSPVASARQAVQAVTAPAQGASSSGAMGGTQAGPTSVTLTHAGSTHRTRILGFSAVAGIVVLGSALFFWSTHSGTNDTAATFSASPILQNAASAPQLSAPTAAAAPNGTPTPVISPVPQATAAAVLSPSTTTSAAVLPDKPKAKPATVGNRASPAAVPNPPPGPPRPTPRNTAVDLAF